MPLAKKMGKGSGHGKELSFFTLCTSLLFEIQRVGICCFCNWGRGEGREKKRRGEERKGGEIRGKGREGWRKGRTGGRQRRREH